jgi:uncharacterized protein YegL
LIRDQDNFYEFVYKTFYDFAEAKVEDIGLICSREVSFPLLQSLQNPVLTIPIPKFIQDKYVYEGMVFENTEESRGAMWSLFLATIYHLSSHAATASYSKYKNWLKNKTMETCWQVIDFIEDVSVERYLLHKEENIRKNIHEIETQILVRNQQFQCEKFQDKNKETEISSLKNEIIENIGKEGYEEKLLLIADCFYNNRQLLERPILPFHERHNPSWSPKVEQTGIKFEPSGIFAEQVRKLDELWEKNERMRNRILRKYQKHLKGLNFDAVVIPTGNLQAYENLKMVSLPMLRRIRQQIRMITNLNDEPKIDQIGYIDMQMAIQSIASEGQSTDIFERDELRRGEEAWVVLIDKSASMELRFDRLKEFAVCVSESANELTGKEDAWALYSFDNNFQIIKDFKEKYNQEIKARIGNIRNGGLSLLPDAIELSARILSDDPRERKYLFVITDGHPSGYDRIQEAFSKTVKKTEISGITLVGIGVTKAVSRKFRSSAKGSDLKQLVTKFITAYKTASSSDM